MMGWHGYPAGGLDLVGLLVLAVFGLLFWGRQHGMRLRPAPRRSRDRSRSALEVAEQRYARGEISREEFLDITNDLYLTQSNYPEKRKRSEG